MKLKSDDRKKKTISFIILLIITVMWMIPLLWGIGTSFKSPSEMAERPAAFLPNQFFLGHYEKLFSRPDTPVLRWMLNSFIIASAFTVLYLSIITLAAYAFGVLRFYLRNVIFYFLLGTTMIPAVMNLVPLISMMIKLNWFNTWLALIIPGTGGVFGMFLLRQFFMSVPYELVESAKIEGMNDFGILIKIIIPLSKSALMVAALFAFMGNWNDYLWPSIMLAGVDYSYYTLPVGLSILSGNYNHDYGLSMAAAILSIVPVCIIYVCLQSKIIEGVAHTGSKF